ncbi:S8 family serine peptidase, partial [bacterium]|nr:S8 family serine peptidase [bacterium]
MSSKDPDGPGRPRTEPSRRSFLRGAAAGGLAGGVVAAGAGSAAFAQTRKPANPAHLPPNNPPWTTEAGFGVGDYPYGVPSPFESHVVRRDVDQANNQWNERRIYRVWPDFEVSATLNKSTQTVKADAARIAFNARGRDIVWAVMDSGVDKNHPHFAKYKNLEVREPVRHDSFVDEDNSDALVDDFGHGTHVAGIIAGCLQLPEAPPPVAAPKAKSGKVAQAKADELAKAAKAEEDARKVYSAHGVREEQSDVRRVDIRPVSELAGVAPECKIVSMKVLDSSGNGTTTAIIRALQRVNEINQNGRRLLIHGVNLSLGYDFDPEWFACGQSPLCVEV